VDELRSKREIDHPAVSQEDGVRAAGDLEIPHHVHPRR
jgi:hypothetical protein